MKIHTQTQKTNLSKTKVAVGLGGLVIGAVAISIAAANYNHLGVDDLASADSTDDGLSILLHGPEELRLITCVFPNLVTGELTNAHDETASFPDAPTCLSATAVDGAEGWDGAAEKAYSLGALDAEGYGLTVDYFKENGTSVASLNSIVSTYSAQKFYATYTLTTPNGTTTVQRDIFQDGMLWDINGDGMYSTTDTTLANTILSSTMMTSGRKLATYADFADPGFLGGTRGTAFYRFNVNNLGESFNVVIADGSASSTDKSVELNGDLYDTIYNIVKRNPADADDPLHEAYRNYVANHSNVEIEYRLVDEAGVVVRYLGIEHQSIGDLLGSNLAFSAKSFAGYTPTKATITVSTDTHQTVVFDYVKGNAIAVPNTGVK